MPLVYIQPAHAILLPTIQANLSMAIRNRQTVTIAGGEFRGEELLALYHAATVALAAHAAGLQIPAAPEP